MQARLFKKASLYPVTYLTAEKVVERKWTSLCAKYGLPEEARTTAVQLVSRASRTGSPHVLAAAATYVAGRRHRVHVTQSDLADEFGITEVSLRKHAQVLIDAVAQEVDACL